MTATIGLATEADCARMPEFRRRMEGGEFLAELRDEPFYRLKYRETGLAFVARDGDRLLGVTAATPRTVALPSGPVPAADLGDLFVDPAARGQGLFRRLHDAVLGELGARGVRLVTVRAGPAAAPLMRERMGYRPLFSVAEAVAALTAAGRASLPLGRVPVLSRILPRARIRPADPPPGFSLTAGEPETLGEASPFGADWPRAGTVRDRDRIVSRYVRDPAPYRAISLTRDGRPAGGAVLLNYRDRGFLVDLWIAPDAAAGADALVAAALAELVRGGAGVVHFWRAREAGPPRDPLARAVRRAGLRVLRRRKAVLVRPVGRAPVPLPLPGEWLFRMGDTDGI